MGKIPLIKRISFVCFHCFVFDTIVGVPDDWAEILYCCSRYTEVLSTPWHVEGCRLKWDVWLASLLLRVKTTVCVYLILSVNALHGTANRAVSSLLTIPFFLPPSLLLGWGGTKQWKLYHSQFCRWSSCAFKTKFSSVFTPFIRRWFLSVRCLWKAQSFSQAVNRMETLSRKAGLSFPNSFWQMLSSSKEITMLLILFKNSLCVTHSRMWLWTPVECKLLFSAHLRRNGSSSSFGCAVVPSRKGLGSKWFRITPWGMSENADFI